jgi:hypothetical protein
VYVSAHTPAPAWPNTSVVGSLHWTVSDESGKSRDGVMPVEIEELGTRADFMAAFAGIARARGEITG